MHARLPVEDNVLFDPVNQERLHHVVQHVEQAGMVYHMDSEQTRVHVECKCIERAFTNVYVECIVEVLAKVSLCSTVR